jgi:DNA-binding NtrC family response regulator
MPPRTRLPDLARLLDASPDPIWVVDGERRIRYVNRACAEWIGRAAEELVGRECRYRTGDESDPASATADALCPPPTALAGGRVSAEVVLPAPKEAASQEAGLRATGGPASAARRADFIPLGIAGLGVTAVLAWVPSEEIAARDDAELRRQESEAERLHALVARLHHDQATRYALDRLLGESPSMRRVRSQIAIAAGVGASLVIVGPKGAGRGRIARTVHYQGKPPEAQPPLVPLDCAVLGAELLQATIRGMTRTARENKRRAGTLLLNDVDRLPADAQAELAGFLRLVDLPIRIISTSAVALPALVAQGEFRADLAAWLSTLVMEVPALSSRPEDIPPIAQRMLEEANGRGSKQIGGFTPEALDTLAQYAWPGEADELAEMVAAAHEKAEGPLVTVRDLPRRLFLAADAKRYTHEPDETIVLDEYLADIERELLRRAMQRAKGNKTRAATLLGVTRPRLYRRLVQLGLEQGPVIFEEATTDGETPEA